MRNFALDIIRDLCRERQTLENLRNEVISSVEMVRFIRADKELWEQVTAKMSRSKKK